MDFKFHDSFIYPDYKNLSLAEISPTILKLFGIKNNRPSLPEDYFSKYLGKIKNIVTVFIDGLGYKQVLRHTSEIETLNKFIQLEAVYPLTSVFPSTTANALTTFYSTLTPQEHGLLEINLYLEEFAGIIETIPFKRITSDQIDSLLLEGGDPKAIFDFTTIYEILKSHSVECFHFNYQKYSSSTFERQITKGANVVSYADEEELMEKARTILNNTNVPTYLNLYWPHIDITLHKFGEDSFQFKDNLFKIFNFLQQEFINKINFHKAQETLVILVADHGHVPLKKEEVVYLNNYPKVVKNLKVDKKGQIITPYGSPREMFLQVNQSKIEETICFLKEIVGKNGQVITTKEAIEKGLFGFGEFSKRFKSRVGDILILSKKGFNIWYEQIPGNKLNLASHHGGLTEEEMLIPLGITTIANLQKL